MVLFQEGLSLNAEPRQARAWLEAAMDALPLMVVATDEAGNIQFANLKAAQQLELDPESIKGLSIHRLLGLLSGEEIMSLPVETVVVEGNHQRFTAVPLLPNTSPGTRWQAVARPLLGADCEIMGMLLTMDCNALPMPEGAAALPISNANTRPALFVRTNGRYSRVLLEELLWVEAMENYVQLQTVRERLIVHATLKGYEEALAGKGYQRIHRSFIVRRDQIERIEENHVVVAGTVLPIGKSYRADLLDSLTLI